MFARRTINSFQRTTKVSCYKSLHCRGKTKVSYYILLRKKNKSIILHHILPNSPENVFLATFVMLKLQQQCSNCQTKYRTISSEGGEHTFHMAFIRNVSLHATKMFSNGNAIADELPNIQFSLTTVRDTSLPGTQTDYR